MATVSIDPTRILGNMKPVHGVGQPPYHGFDFKLFHYLNTSIEVNLVN